MTVPIMKNNYTVSENQKIALVLANGPSAKFVDFQDQALKNIVTVGMNSAFRYWRKIDFRPTHYICMDTEVIRSIADDIAALVNENRIKKFFLRDELKELHPELADDEKIFWFSQANGRSALFESSFITTGSWAIRWMLYEQARLIATIGIDGIQTEILPEAKRLGGGSDIRLQITNTPKFNPNYFFSDYQKAGDRYNIPNHPDYVRAAGTSFHIDALKAVSDFMIRNEMTAKVVDLSPISDHKIFKKCSYSSFFHKLKFTIITSFHSREEASVLENNAQVAIENCKNPFVSDVHILLEGDRDHFNVSLNLATLNQVRNLEESGKLTFFSIEQRPSYKVLFEHGNSEGSGTSCIIANSDIVIPLDTAEKIISNRFSGAQPIYALTRWNKTANGDFIQGLTSTPPWWELDCNNMTLLEKNYLSFDTYIFDSPLEVPELTDQILLGSFGCDTALVGLLRVHGYTISNPCLSLKTIHIDEKIRNYDPATVSPFVEKNIVAFRDSVMKRYLTSPEIRKNLDRVSELSRTTAWIGHGKSVNIWRNLYRAIGSVSWSKATDFQSIKYKKISLSSEDLKGQRLDAISLIEELERHSVFLEWELSGFSESEHISDLFLKYDKYKKLGDYLSVYQWQSMVFTDIVSPDIRSIHSDLLLVVYDLLSHRDLGQLVSNREESRNLEFTGISIHGDVTQEGGSFTLSPPAGERHIFCKYSGSIRSGENLIGNVDFEVDRSCLLQISLSRFGDTKFESTSKDIACDKGKQSVEISHCFSSSHAGAKIQIGAKDCRVKISGVKSNLKRDEQAKNHAQIPTLCAKIAHTKDGRRTKYTHDNAKDLIDGLIILDPDGKNARGHFLAYCDQLTLACKKVGILPSVLCRLDIEPSLLESRSSFHPLFSTHSWTIATTESTFLAEIRAGLSRFDLSGKQRLLVYLYTGSLHHARVFLNLSKDLPHIKFNCNLFWEMVRDISTPEYDELCAEVFRKLKVQENVILTVPTEGLRKEFFERFHVSLKLAPHPSTAVSDDFFEEIRKCDSRLQFDVKYPRNILFPGAATQSKGYEVSLEVTRALSTEQNMICWMRDEKKGILAPDVRVIPDNLSEADFQNLIQNCDLLVLPYMPDGFRKRTSGILIDAMYFGVPVVVCAGTWLADIVDHYKFGIAANPTKESIVSAINSVLSDLPKYRAAARVAATAYFQENSWSKLMKSLLPEKKQIAFSALTTSAGSDEKPCFKKANHLLRKGQNAAALNMYIRLHSKNPLQIYENNSMLCAYRLGWQDCGSFLDIKKRALLKG
ncbi:glycosyltransferase [Ectothiorhodospira lacustris]|uniref:glycosyltransferase n=1 Tax=Ectothiorhodospira lacustris TaxID=2899127 RepID=UPI001EE93149|nr:glycosyltransferase [Ectothiorhodospira lacustris]MCG5510655.1 glycosyltransferase [Ectothiorhodospira lacustris]MCG5522445.1 glycosyltransferase [Ectothiorhodospira lacustris]